MKETERKILCMLNIAATARPLLTKWTTEKDALTDEELDKIFENTTFSSNGQALDFLDNLESIFSKMVILAVQKGHEMHIG